MALPQDGQNANGLTKVTEIPKGKELIFIDPTTNEGGIITLEDLTTQILKNLTSQTFALDQGTKTLPAALNELNSNLTAKSYAYTPSLSWSKGTVNPTVKNIDAYFSQYGKVCFAYVRYNIADLGTFDKESFLEITLPSGITSLVTSVSLVSPYQIVEGNASLGVRVSSNKVIIVNGVGGNYSAEYIKKGYQGFSVFFITK